MCNKTFIEFSFVDIKNYQGLSMYYQGLKLWQMVQTSTLIILDINKASSNNCLMSACMTLKKLVPVLKYQITQVPSLDHLQLPTVDLYLSRLSS